MKWRAKSFRKDREMRRSVYLGIMAYIYNIIDNEDVNTGEELTKLSEQIHQAVEDACCDYCITKGIVDYETPTI